MQISTIYYHLKKMVGIDKAKETNTILVDGLADSLEPSLSSINKIMAFSDAYQYKKSDMIGEVEYMIN